jgi:hypothetical protein
MSKGHVFLAQNSDVDYIKQAYALALSIKSHNQLYNNTCLITNDVVPEEYKHAFDYIIAIPWTDLANTSGWKIENRWKIIHATPFKENIVYDVDMLLLNSNDHWWKFFEGRDLLLPTTVTTYRNTIVSSDYYRKVFTNNNLPNVYCGAFYFKKVARSFEFFKWIEVITANWQQYYKTFLPNNTQKFASIDVSAALAIKLMDCYDCLVPAGICVPGFTHMKPALQGWYSANAKWTDTVGSYFDSDCNLFVGNFLQKGLFHYVEEQFLTDDVIHKLFQKSRIA